MGKTGLIIQREYITRVRKKSFVIMTILGPLLMGSLFVIPILLADYTSSVKIIKVIDETGIMQHGLKNNDDILFVYENQSLKKAKNDAIEKGYYGIIHVPAFPDNDIRNLQNNIRFYAVNHVSLGVKTYVRSQLERQIERLQLESQNVDPALVESVKLNSNVPLPVMQIEPGRFNTNVEVNTMMGLAGGLFSYLFVFMFAVQAMRGVIEEKTNRVVELIISSVRPFQLLMGKIIGISLVGLTQFALWIVLTGSIYGIFMSTIVKERYSSSNMEMLMKKSPDGTIADIDRMEETGRIIDSINSINWQVEIPLFLFYFLAGFLLYGAIFAAIGSAVDSETDTQQFMLPVTIPLIFSVIMMQSVMNEPAGELARWLSIIPFTSPVIMMVRIPFGVPVWEIILSMGLLVATFVFSTWVAAKIYRTGILMYGKKPSWKEVWRWMKY